MANNCFKLAVAAAALLPSALSLPTGFVPDSDDTNGWHRVDDPRTNRPDATVDNIVGHKLHGEDDIVDPRVIWSPNTIVKANIKVVDMPADWRPYRDGYSNVIKNDLARFPPDLPDPPYEIFGRSEGSWVNEPVGHVDHKHDTVLLWGPETKFKGTYETSIKMPADWQPYPDGYAHVIGNDLARFEAGEDFPPQEVVDAWVDHVKHDFKQDTAKRSVEKHADEKHADEKSPTEINFDNGNPGPSRDMVPIWPQIQHIKGPVTPIEMPADWQPYPDGYKNVIEHDVARFKAMDEAREREKEASESLSKRAHHDDTNEKSPTEINFDNGHPGPSRDMVRIWPQGQQVKGPISTEIKMPAGWHPYPDGYKNVVEHDIERFNAMDEAREREKEVAEGEHSHRKSKDHKKSKDDDKKSKDDDKKSKDDDKKSKDDDKKSKDDDKKSKDDDKKKHKDDDDDKKKHKDDDDKDDDKKKHKAAAKVGSFPVPKNDKRHDYNDNLPAHWKEEIWHDLDGKTPHDHIGRILGWTGKPVELSGPDRVTQTAYASWERNPALRLSYTDLAERKTLDSHPHAVDATHPVPTRDPWMPAPTPPTLRPVPQVGKRDYGNKDADVKKTDDKKPDDKKTDDVKKPDDVPKFDTSTIDHPKVVEDADTQKKNEKLYEALSWTSGRPVDEIALEAELSDVILDPFGRFVEDQWADGDMPALSDLVAEN
jgi:hypothetical protein